MALTSSALKTLIKAEIEAVFGTVGQQPNLSQAEAHDLHAEAVAKAVVKWIAANGTGAVSTPGVNTGSSTVVGNLLATDNL